MTRRSATFQEVSLALGPSAHLLKESSTSVPRDINLLQRESKLNLFCRSRSFLRCITGFSRMSLKVTSGSSNSRNKSPTSSALTVDEYHHESESEEREVATVVAASKSVSSPKVGAFSQLRKALHSLSRFTKSPLKDKRRGSNASSTDNFPCVIKEAPQTQARVEGWTQALKSAIELDFRGDGKEALVAYSKFNRKVTKEAINDFELFTCDQQKLMTHVMFGVDRRVRSLKKAVLGRDFSESNNSSTTSETSTTVDDSTLAELRHLVTLLETIKTIGSKRTMPVVLVYRERRHRTHHREKLKGKSNKIIFPKEKRDFLQMMGLPAKMITVDGLDFTVEPELEEIPGLIPRSQGNSKSSSRENSESMETATEIPQKRNGNVEESPAHSGTDGSLMVPKKEERKLSIVGQFLSMRKRLSVSPQHDSTSQEVSGSQYRSKDTVSECDFSELSSAHMTTSADARSTLSCDSCSSNETPVSDIEENDVTDTAVLANYVHKESVLSLPMHTPDGTYAVLGLEKIGVKNTSALHSPFMRVSMRDSKGNLLAKVQETLPWEIINRHYLRAPGPIFIQETLESLPEDTAFFLELRHFIRDKRKLRTLCYTYLEKCDIQSGEFVCELYRPPIQFSRETVNPYTDKAFFLHLDVKIEADDDSDEYEDTEEIITVEKKDDDALPTIEIITVEKKDDDALNAEDIITVEKKEDDDALTT